ncbi:mitochondrial basic amino acids transporter-like [Ornithodoros turicata]|uniref:mitochondrial basic amino acids transporter-like n=1 Tax=Ornithodoros turicata TaxID=34597 RepID=UPI0031389C3D
MALDFVAGCLGGCAGVIVGHPFDTIKVRLQIQDGSSPKYKGSFDCFRAILKTESVRGLYRGLTSPMAGVAFINAVVFGVYGNVQRQLGTPDSVAVHFASGIAAGTVQSLIGSPIELAKTRLQVQGLASKSSIYSGPVDCLRQIHRAEGIRGVFRGLGSTVLRDAPAFGVYFASYEFLVRKTSEKGGPVSNLELMMAGGLAGVFSWIVSYPCDVVKSRLQVDGMEGPRRYNSFLDCAVKSYKNEGVTSFTRGLNSTLLRAFPTNAAIFMVVTWVLRLCDGKTSSVRLETAHHHAVHFDADIRLNRVASIVDSYAESVFLF